MSRPGDRVGAILSGNDDGSINFLGYGVYEGDFIPDEAVGWMADVCREVGTTNPRIRLDSGKVVYGCECWWGKEEEVMKRLEGRTVIECDIDQVRKEEA